MGGTGQPLGFASDEIADAVSDRVFTFGADLRVVWANRSLKQALPSGADPVGRTLGEILGCRHAGSGQGCGAAAACETCGWFSAAAACLQERAPDACEVRILSRTGEAYEFSVTMRVMRNGDAGPQGMCALRDLFRQKRLRVLERIFFHDVTNLAAGIRGLCEVMSDTPSDSDPEVLSLLRGSAEKMVDEIQRLRVLRMAENGDLAASPSAFLAGDLLRAVVAHFADETAARRLEVIVDDRLGAAAVVSDRDFLQVVLCDLFQNAVEASRRGDRVELFCGAGEEGGVVFRVLNPAVLTDDVRAHLFERSFTTRGPGKGVGAYRAKLLGERFLGGTVSWRSQAPEGTAVSVALPGAPDTKVG